MIPSYFYFFFYLKKYFLPTDFKNIKVEMICVGRDCHGRAERQQSRSVCMILLKDLAIMEFPLLNYISFKILESKFIMHFMYFC